jgi:hypothetical protein
MLMRVSSLAAFISAMSFSIWSKLSRICAIAAALSRSSCFELRFELIIATTAHDTEHTQAMTVRIISKYDMFMAPNYFQ